MSHTDSEMMRENMGQALVTYQPTALKAAVRDPELWSSAHDGIQEYLSNRAGNWLMRLVWSFFARILLFVVLGSLVYAVGGWTAVASFFTKSEGLK